MFNLFRFNKLALTPINEPTNRLFKAVTENDVLSARRAIENGADVNARNGWAILVASSLNNYEIVECLVQNGANVNRRNNQAIFNCVLEKLKMLKCKIELEKYWL